MFANIKKKKKSGGNSQKGLVLGFYLLGFILQNEALMETMDSLTGPSTGYRTQPLDLFLKFQTVLTNSQFSCLIYPCSSNNGFNSTALLTYFNIELCIKTILKRKCSN